MSVLKKHTLRYIAPFLLESLVGDRNPQDLHGMVCEKYPQFTTLPKVSQDFLHQFIYPRVKNSTDSVHATLALLCILSKEGCPQSSLVLSSLSYRFIGNSWRAVYGLPTLDSVFLYHFWFRNPHGTILKTVIFILSLLFQFVFFIRFTNFSTIDLVCGVVCLIVNFFWLDDFCKGVSSFPVKAIGEPGFFLYWQLGFYTPSPPVTNDNSGFATYLLCITRPYWVNWAPYFQLVHYLYKSFVSNVLGEFVSGFLTLLTFRFLVGFILTLIMLSLFRFVWWSYKKISNLAFGACIKISKTTKETTVPANNVGKMLWLSACSALTILSFVSGDPRGLFDFIRFHDILVVMVNCGTSLSFSNAWSELSNLFVPKIRKDALFFNTFLSQDRTAWTTQSALVNSALSSGYIVYRAETSRGPLYFWDSQKTMPVKTIGVVQAAPFIFSGALDINTFLMPKENVEWAEAHMQYNDRFLWFAWYLEDPSKGYDLWNANEVNRQPGVRFFSTSDDSVRACVVEPEIPQPPSYIPGKLSHVTAVGGVMSGIFGIVVAVLWIAYATRTKKDRKKPSFSDFCEWFTSLIFGSKFVVKDAKPVPVITISRPPPPFVVTVRGSSTPVITTAETRHHVNKDVGCHTSGFGDTENPMDEIEDAWELPEDWGDAENWPCAPQKGDDAAERKREEEDTVPYEYKRATEGQADGTPEKARSRKRHEVTIVSCEGGNLFTEKSVYHIGVANGKKRMIRSSVETQVAPGNGVADFPRRKLSHQIVESNVENPSRDVSHIPVVEDDVAGLAEKLKEKGEKVDESVMVDFARIAAQYYGQKYLVKTVASAAVKITDKLATSNPSKSSSSSASPSIVSECVETGDSLKEEAPPKVCVTSTSVTSTESASVETRQEKKQPKKETPIVSKKVVIEKSAAKEVKPAAPKVASKPVVEANKKTPSSTLKVGDVVYFNGKQGILLRSQGKQALVSSNGANVRLPMTSLSKEMQKESRLSHHTNLPTSFGIYQRTVHCVVGNNLIAAGQCWSPKVNYLCFTYHQMKIIMTDCSAEVKKQILEDGATFQVCLSPVDSKNPELQTYDLKFVVSKNVAGTATTPQVDFAICKIVKGNPLRVPKLSFNSGDCVGNVGSLLAYNLDTTLWHWSNNANVTPAGRHNAMSENGTSGAPIWNGAKQVVIGVHHSGSDMINEYTPLFTDELSQAIQSLN